jgi:hypothetical protein
MDTLVVAMIPAQPIRSSRSSGPSRRSSACLKSSRPDGSVRPIQGSPAFEPAQSVEIGGSNDAPERARARATAARSRLERMLVDDLPGAAIEDAISEAADAGRHIGASRPWYLSHLSHARAGTALPSSRTRQKPQRSLRSGDEQAPTQMPGLTALRGPASTLPQNSACPKG